MRTAGGAECGEWPRAAKRRLVWSSARSSPAAAAAAAAAAVAAVAVAAAEEEEEEEEEVGAAAPSAAATDVAPSVAAAMAMDAWVRGAALPHLHAPYEVAALFGRAPPAEPS